MVGVPTHLFGRHTKAMIDAYERGDHAEALRLHHALLPVFYGFFATQGVILTKAALNRVGQPAGPTRPPLVDATEAQVERLVADCAAAGLSI